MIERVKKYMMVLALVEFTGCVSGVNVGNSLLSGEHGYENRFNTNQYAFLTPSLDATSTQQDRNSFLEEFISQSNMQCQHYLGNPQHRTQSITSSAEQTLYMSIFDTVSMLFGVKYITDVAKGVFLSNTTTNTPENQSMYQNALGPEIIRGVEIARLRYANLMRAKKAKSLEHYSVEHFQSDMVKYDKQCSNEFGLMEINNALREAQTQMMRSGIVKPKIDPVEIKKKVEVATKKVEEKTHKEEMKKELKKEIKEEMKKREIQKRTKTQDAK
jgi:hypothetical protein